MPDPLTAPLTLRPGTPGDLAFMCSLAPRLVAALPEGRDRAAAQARTETLFREVLLPEVAVQDDLTAVLIVQQAGQPAGFALLYLLPHEAAVFIKDFAVSADAEGQGVARFLMDGVRAWANERGCRELQLKTNWNNHRARAFYEGAGFQAEYVMLVQTL